MDELFFYLSVKVIRINKWERKKLKAVVRKKKWLDKRWWVVSQILNTIVHSEPSSFFLDTIIWYWFAQVLHSLNNKNAFKTLIAAEYTGVQVELAKNFEMGVTNKTPEFLKLNPIGKVSTFFFFQILLCLQDVWSFKFWLYVNSGACVGDTWWCHFREQCYSSIWYEWIFVHCFVVLVLAIFHVFFWSTIIVPCSYWNSKPDLLGSILLMPIKRWKSCWLLSDIHNYDFQYKVVYLLVWRSPSLQTELDKKLLLHFFK